MKWGMFLACALVASSCGAKSGNPVPVWTMLHVYYDNGDGEVERDEVCLENDVIAGLSDELKLVVARYVALNQWVWDEDSRRFLAREFGNYDSLEQACDSLLKGWDDTEFMRFRRSFPAALQFRQTGRKRYCFDYKPMYGEWCTDEFEITNGRIRYIAPPEKIEPSYYDRAALVDKERYGGYIVKLNGEPIELEYWWLDPENVRSVGINELDRVIYITQKETAPEYFTRGNIDVAQLPIGIKSLDELTYISIKDKTTADWYREFYEQDRIEASFIKNIGCWTDDEYNIKGVAVVLKSLE